MSSAERTPSGAPGTGLTLRGLPPALVAASVPAQVRDVDDASVRATVPKEVLQFWPHRFVALQYTGETAVQQSAILMRDIADRNQFYSCVRRGSSSNLCSSPPCS